VTFLATLVRVLLALLLLRLLVRVVANVVRGYRAPAAPPVPRVQELVRDRVCGTFVPRARALTAAVGGQDEFFCSPACRDRALAAGPAALVEARRG
jgi:hypothetical protein